MMMLPPLPCSVNSAPRDSLLDWSPLPHPSCRLQSVGLASTRNRPMRRLTIDETWSRRPPSAPRRLHGEFKITNPCPVHLSTLEEAHADRLTRLHWPSCRQRLSRHPPTGAGTVSGRTDAVPMVGTSLGWFNWWAGPGSRGVGPNLARWPVYFFSKFNYCLNTP
jgi:hypothetical protein